MPQDRRDAFQGQGIYGFGYADTLDKKIPRLILNEMVTGGKSYVKMDSPQMSQPPERSSE